MNTCQHLDTIKIAQPSEEDKQGSACEDCQRLGSTWVHLRQCLSCGKVGCCDSSPRRHARRHSESHDHPVVASMESGEGWRYCFKDDLVWLPGKRSDVELS